MLMILFTQFTQNLSSEWFSEYHLQFQLVLGYILSFSDLSVVKVYDLGSEKALWSYLDQM